MKAIGFLDNFPADHANALVDLELPVPEPRPRDLRVRVQAVSVNPVDTKVRRNRKAAAGVPEVLGWDAVGTVDAVGSEVQGFQVGDRVFYAGAINRPGANSELHLVDERIVGRAPASLNDEQAAALPLTTITAYELLFDRLKIAKNGGAGETLVVIGGAGGVGSILIQLARQLTQLRVVATASRPETRQWCLDLGAHAVVDHSQPLASALKAAGIDAVDHVAALTQTQHHFAQIIEALKPFGSMAVIDDMAGLDVMLMKTKSIALHLELMFTRSMFQTPDMAEQGRLLSEIAKRVDAGQIRSTVNTSLGKINAENLRRAHALIETGKAQGKVVLSGF